MYIYRYIHTCIYLSDQISRSVVFYSLQPHESQHARPPCPSPPPGTYIHTYIYINICMCVYIYTTGGSVVKNLPDDAEDVGLILGAGRPPGDGNGNLLPYSCLENPLHCRQRLYHLSHQGSPAIVHRVSKESDTT